MDVLRRRVLGLHIGLGLKQSSVMENVRLAIELKHLESVFLLYNSGQATDT